MFDFTLLNFRSLVNLNIICFMSIYLGPMQTRFVKLRIYIIFYKINFGGKHERMNARREGKYGVSYLQGIFENIILNFYLFFDKNIKYSLI